MDEVYGMVWSERAGPDLLPQALNLRGCQGISLLIRLGGDTSAGTWYEYVYKIFSMYQVPGVACVAFFRAHGRQMRSTGYDVITRCLGRVRDSYFVPSTRYCLRRPF